MIVSKNSTPTQPAVEPQEPIVESKRITTVEEAYSVNPMTETYKAIRKILEGLHDDPNDDSSPRLFKTIKLDTGQLSRVKNNKHNLQYALAFPAVFIHFIDVYYNIGQSRIGEGKGTCRIHYVLNTLNNEDDEVEAQGFEIFNRINEAINAHKNEFPALVNRFQLAYWDMPETFDDGVQPFWIDYQIWFNDYSAYRYKDYKEVNIVIPPFTNHSDQLPESNPENHPDHKEEVYDQHSGFEEFGVAINPPAQISTPIYNGQAHEPQWSKELENVEVVSLTPEINAGTYRAIFRPKVGFTWDDGSTGMKIVKWTILKSKQEFSFPVSDIVLQAEEEIEIEMHVELGDGLFFVEDFNGDIANVRVVNNRLIIKGNSSGEYNLEVVKAETSNFYESRKTIRIMVADIAYSGVSQDVPDTLDRSAPHVLPTDNLISIQTGLEDKMRCHWVAVKADSGYVVSKITDVNNEDLSFELASKEIDGFVVYYYRSSVFISNTTMFYITKN